MKKTMSSWSRRCCWAGEQRCEFVSFGIELEKMEKGRYCGYGSIRGIEATVTLRRSYGRRDWLATITFRGVWGIEALGRTRQRALDALRIKALECADALRAGARRPNPVL